MVGGRPRVHRLAGVTLGLQFLPFEHADSRRKLFSVHMRDAAIALRRSYPVSGASLPCLRFKERNHAFDRKRGKRRFSPLTTLLA